MMPTSGRSYRDDGLSYTDSVVSPPTVSALTLDQAKLHIRSLGATDDALVAIYINAAASYFEEQTGRQLLTATREMWLEAFPFLGASGLHARIELPHPPLQRVTGITFTDTDGVLRALDDGASPPTNTFAVAAPAGPYCRRGSVEPFAGSAWPLATAQTGAVKIRYICGYGDGPEAMPDLIQQVLGFLVAHFDTHRAPVPETRGQIIELPYGVRAMLEGFKYTAFPSQELRRIGRGYLG